MVICNYFLNIFSYIGDWKDDMCNGYGVYTHQDGTVYKGEWVNDK